MLPTQRILENRDRVGSNMAASAASVMPEMDFLTRNCMYVVYRHQNDEMYVAGIWHNSTSGSQCHLWALRSKRPN